MELVLVRHAQPQWALDGLAVDDPPLTALGQDQAVRVADRLSTESAGFDEVWISPLVRARETAAPLLVRLDTDEMVAPWLEEIRNPVWQGSPAEKAQAAFAADRARPAHERWEGLPGGESVRDFVARMRTGADLFLAERGVRRADGALPVWTVDEPGRRFLCVAHAGTNSIVMCHLLGLQPTPWEWDRFVMDHASITRLEALPVGEHFTFSVTRLSDVEHLPADLRTR